MVIAAEVILTVMTIYFLVCISRSSQSSIVEVVIAKAWQNRFARTDILQKREQYVEKNKKYHMYSDKKLQKKIKEDEKQINAYQKNEEKYLSGKGIGIIDLFPLFGYGFCNAIGLDADSNILRTMVMDCEQSGYIGLERGQETNGKKNSMIYSYYLLASVFSYIYLGIMTGLFIFVLMIFMKKEVTVSLAISVIIVAVMVIIGYLPLDALKNKAMNRKEEIDREFPNVVSKLVLLLLSGMNISRAVEQTAASGDSLIYRELSIVVKESSQSVSLEGALTHLQSKCDNKYLDKLVTIISKSFSAGNANLAEDLRSLNDECWLEKKHSARRMADKVQTKLFVPTMIMFVGILVVIIIPVMSGFNLGI